MDTTAPSSSGLTNATSAADLKIDLYKQLKSHEVAIAELDNLQSSRAVYQRSGNLFFRTTIQRAKLMEHNQIDSAKAKLKFLS